MRPVASANGENDVQVPALLQGIGELAGPPVSQWLVQSKENKIKVENWKKRAPPPPQTDFHLHPHICSLARLSLDLELWSCCVTASQSQCVS